MTDETDNFWEGRTVMVTGGAGFLGKNLVEALDKRSDTATIFIPRSTEYDLRRESDVKSAFQDSGADTVIHLAASVGGIGANEQNPGRYFYDNAIMGIELIEQARQHNVEKFTILGTICSYPKHTPVPFSEDYLFNGYPEGTNAPYGIAKKSLLTQSCAYRKQWAFNSIYLLPANLYGPRDNFDLNTSHVIPAIIRKSIAAKEHGDESITAWGTGEPTRDFLYVKDAADGILDATESYNSSEPVNLGSGEEIGIQELVEIIVDEIGFEGKVKWDNSKPDGQTRRKLDTSRAKEHFGWEASTELLEGIRKTIEWYNKNRK